jgi:glycosyltransferase involved in cell wall biosynthesis
MLHFVTSRVNTKRVSGLPMSDRRRTILQVLPRLDTGGAERVVVEITEALTTNGHRALIACETGPLAQAALRAGAEIVELPLGTKSPFNMRRNASRLAALIKEQNVELVHAHSRAPAWSALWATRKTRTPFVTTYHGTYSEDLPFKRQYNGVMAEGDRVIAVSQFIAGLVRQRHGVDEAILRTIPGGVDTRKFDPAAVLGDRVTRLARDWRLDMGAPTVMLPGRLTAWKGQQLAISALAMLQHSDALLVLVGGDQGREAYAQSLVALAESLGVSDRLRMVGHTEDMPAALMLADIVLNCSTDPEAFGRVVIEAQAMGRMVIAANHGGAAETIADRVTGRLVPPGDPAALADAIDSALMLTAEERIAWGTRARALVAENYSVSAMQYAVMRVYGELLD